MSSVTNIQGVIRRGGDVPVIDPHSPVIIGLDVPYSKAYWFAYCPRVNEPLDEEFIESIRKPNKVHDAFHACRDGNRVLVLDGRRRLRGARIVWDEQEAAGVPRDKRVIVRFEMHTGTPAELFRINRSANADRKELTPVQRALLMAHFAEHVDGLGAVASEFGCTVQTVKNNLALLNCSENVQRAIGAGTIAATAAARLARMPRAEQDAKLEQMVARGATRGAAAAEVMRTGDHLAPLPLRLRPPGFFERLHCDLDPATSESIRVAHAVLGFSLGDEHALEPWPELQEHAMAALKRRRPVPASSGEQAQELSDPRQLELVS